MEEAELEEEAPSSIERVADRGGGGRNDNGDAASVSLTLLLLVLSAPRNLEEGIWEAMSDMMSSTATSSDDDETGTVMTPDRVLVGSLRLVGVNGGLETSILRSDDGWVRIWPPFFAWTSKNVIPFVSGRNHLGLDCHRVWRQGERRRKRPCGSGSRHRSSAGAHVQETPGHASSSKDWALQEDLVLAALVKDGKLLEWPSVIFVLSLSLSSSPRITNERACLISSLSCCRRSSI